MGFEAHHAIHHLRTDRLQHLSPIDVGFLIKARLELHHHRNLLALAHRLAQQVHQLRVGTGTVNRLFDSQHLRVMDGFPQEGQDTVKTFERLVNENVALLELVKDGLPCHQLLRRSRLVRRKAQVGPVCQINELRQAHQIDRARHTEQRLLRQLKLLQQKIRQVLRAPRRHLQAYRLPKVTMHQPLA